jgi:hypothetical protein
MGDVEVATLRTDGSGSERSTIRSQTASISWGGGSPVVREGPSGPPGPALSREEAERIVDEHMIAYAGAESPELQARIGDAMKRELIAAEQAARASREAPASTPQQESGFTPEQAQWSQYWLQDAPHEQVWAETDAAPIVAKMDRELLETTRFVGARTGADADATGSILADLADLERGTRRAAKTPDEYWTALDRAVPGMSGRAIAAGAEQTRQRIMALNPLVRRRIESYAKGREGHSRAWSPDLTLRFYELGQHLGWIR